jgi:2-oxoglutarate ferredoxin oxidoreductase subunit beta
MSVNAPTKLTMKDYKSELHNDWCAGCIAPDTLIHTDSGVRPISQIEVGEKVLAHDGRHHRVLKTMSHHHAAPMFRLRVQGFGDVVLTDDHPVFVLKREYASSLGPTGTPGWVPAQDVRVGDQVAYPVPAELAGDSSLSLWYAKKKKDTRSRDLPIEVPLGDDLLTLAGYYLAEGHVHERRIVFTFSNQERDLAENVVRLVGKLTELPASITERPTKHTLDVSASSSYLAEIFVRWFGTGAASKHVPPRMMELSPSRQVALLHGLWAGDGWHGEDRASYRTISRTLAEQIKLLLLRQGILPTIHVEAAHGMHREAYAVNVSSADDYARLAEILEWAPILLPHRASPRVPATNGYVFLPVRSNERFDYDGMVHNLEVEGANSYVTSAAALHNCGDFGILTSIQMALAQQQLDPDKVAVFSGIGCSGKTPHYINAYGFHTLHGRVLTVATGARLANTKLTVLALGGDGDGYGIGAGYFVGAGRRNVDFAYIVHNNNVYGLTKGQASPTLAKGKKTKSMPEPSIQDGINPVAMAIAAGYTFIARAYALEPKYTAGIIARAMQHRGAALVDVLQTCPTYNDLYTKEWYEGADLPEKRSRLYKLEDQGFDGKVKDPNDAQEIIAKKSAAVARSYEAEPIPIGVYYEIDLPTYEDEVFRRIPDLKETPLVEQNSFERDIDPLLEAMR